MAKKIKFVGMKEVQLVAILGGLILLVTIINSAQLLSINSSLTAKVVAAKEASRPANIQYTVVTDNSCADCYNISAVVLEIESSGVNITSSSTVDFSSAQGKSIVSQYDIQKLPSVVITGELNKSTANTLNAKLSQSSVSFDGALVFSNPLPPYYDIASDSVRGRVSIVEINNTDCSECTSLSALFTQLKSAGVDVVSSTVVSSSSAQGQSLISKYNITELPSMIMNSEAGVYPTITQAWSQLGVIALDGSYVLKTIAPPYYSVSDGRVRGLVNWTVVVDSACANCYDPISFNLPILKNYGLPVTGAATVDVQTPEGKAIAAEFNITKLPAFLLQGDVSMYSSLMQVWPTVGTDDNGTYVFRASDLGGVYENYTV